MSTESTKGFSFKQLRAHLQYAVDLEFWTIPFYMAAMYSIRDPSDRAYRLLQSIVYQEMFHLQLAANIANAYGDEPPIWHPIFRKPDDHFPDYEFPVYKDEIVNGKKVGVIPHLNFALDDPDPREIFSPYSAEIGPFDLKRLNGMCLVEYPEWDTQGQPSLSGDTSKYGSIGEFYDAVEIAAAGCAEKIRGNATQVDLFGRFYLNFSQPTITEDGVAGLKQVLKLIKVITDQGEGQTEGEADIPAEYRNTADDVEPHAMHFSKLDSLRKIMRHPEDFPKTYPLIPEPDSETQKEQQKAQERLKDNYSKFKVTLNELFSGGQQPRLFAVEMAKLGGNILRCLQLVVIPNFNFPVEEEGV
jgi:hypothetical protein